MIIEYKPVFHLSKKEAEAIASANHTLTDLQGGEIKIQTVKGYSETFKIVVDE